MKKYIVMIALALIVGNSLHAWHRGRGWGGWGGWGPSVGFTVPIGGSSPKYIVPSQPGDPYNTYTGLFPKANPIKNPDSYRRWLYSNYSQDQASRWWNQFAGRYNEYQATRPSPSAYFSVGTGGYWGGGPYWGGSYWGGGWGRPGVGVGFAF